MVRTATAKESILRRAWSNWPTRVEFCVSGKVATEVEKKLAFGFEPMGERKVKNISDPVHVFRITLDKRNEQRRLRLYLRPVLLAAVALVVWAPPH